MRITNGIRLTAALSLIFQAVGCCGPQNAPIQSLSTLSTDDVAEVDVTLIHLESEGDPVERTVRSRDRAAIDSLLAVINKRKQTTDCKCPELGYIRFLGPRGDFRVGIMPGHSTGNIDLHKDDHTRWAVPHDEFIDVLKRVGVSDFQAVFGQQGTSQRP